MNALNSVYNHYLSTYAPRSSSRHGIHRKNELHSIYDSIAKVNRESPWYLPNNSPEVQDYVIELKQTTHALEETIASLGGLDESRMLSKKAAYSSNDEIATASYSGSGNSSVDSFTMEVKSLASPQENMGTFLPNDVTTLEPDTYSFDLEINKMNYEFQFSIDPSETNKGVQARLMKLINGSGIGIKASLAETSGKTALVLRSEATGHGENQETLFTVSDKNASKRHGAVAYFGLDYVSRAPGNAEFTVDGEEMTSTTNQFTVYKNFEVRLRGTTPAEQSVTIGLKTDVESLVENIVTLTRGYNEFIDASSKHLTDQPRSKHILREMATLTNYYQDTFASLGVSVESDNRLHVNTDKLRREFVEAEDINATFNTFKNFSNSLLRKSNQISVDPMNYVEKTIVAYKNPGKSFVNPYLPSAYSGMFFNGYC